MIGPPYHAYVFEHLPRATLATLPTALEDAVRQLTPLLAVLPAAAIDLTEDGEARCAIVLAEGAPRIVSYAADELQHFLQEMSGAEI